MPGFRHRCHDCDMTFHSAKAVAAHKRKKHDGVSVVTKFVGRSLFCPVCACRFGSRTRLIAHLSEHRNRGRRQFTCRALLRSGMLAPVPEQEHRAVHAEDRRNRKRARQSGHTQPLAPFTAKRQRIGGSISKQAMSVWESLSTDEVIPTNRLEWRTFPPLKRLRSKTNLDLVAGAWARP